MPETAQFYPVFTGRLGLQQRVLPAYRAPLFDLLAQSCQGGLSVFAGQAGEEEAISAATKLNTAQYVRSANLAPLRAHHPLYLLWQRGIRQWLESWDPEVLILEANSRYLSNRYALRWMHQRGRRVIGWGLGSPRIEGSGLISSLRRRERASYLRSLDGVIAYSQRGADEYRELGIPSDRIWIALNAVEPRPTSPAPNRPNEYQGRPFILYVGRLQARKRLALLLQACAALKDEFHPRLVIVGDGPERFNLQALAREIFPQAEFTGDRRGAELDLIFLQADLFVLPGTGGLAVQQAMRRALPVIVADGDGTQDDLVRPENGWRVEPGNLDALTGVLRTALADPRRLRAMGQASFRIVAEEANLEKMVQSIVQAAQQISPGGGTRKDKQS